MEKSCQIIDDPKSKQEMEEESFTYAMQLVNSNVLSMAMYSAIELDIFDIIELGLMVWDYVSIIVTNLLIDHFGQF